MTAFGLPDRIWVLVFFAGLWCLAAPDGAYAFPFSYAHEHPAFCSEAWRDKTSARGTCGSAAFCALHGNDDRLSRLICDPYKSEANPSLPSITVSHGWLTSSLDLTDAEMRSKCQPDGLNYGVCALSDIREKTRGTGDRLLPGEMKKAKLALRADISVYVFPVTVVRLGIGAGGTGWIEASWNINGNGPRETHSARLNQSEIDHLLVAVDKSNFWRLPHESRHLGATDGEVAAIELSVPGWRHDAMGAIGDSDAVDLSVLVNSLSQIIGAHWHNVPGGETK